MSRDQTELRPGGATPASQASGDNTRPRSADRGAGPVPDDNRAGHHPEHEQDQPDLDAFVARFNGEDHAHDTDEAPADGGFEVRATGAPLPPDHGANAGPVAVPAAGLRVTRTVLRGGVRVTGKVLHLGARLIDAVADRLDPPRAPD